MWPQALLSEPHASLPQVQERFLADGNDRLKLLVLLCGEDDEKVQNAAAGGPGHADGSPSETVPQDDPSGERGPRGPQGRSRECL